MLPLQKDSNTINLKSYTSNIMMQILAIELDINEKLFLRNPQRTNLGRKILKESILLIDEIGFESFTFKKLAARIHSTEASVYRYFESKYFEKKLNKKKANL